MPSMLRLEARPQPSGFWSYGSPLLALLALIENSSKLQKSLAHAERETQRRSLEMQQHLAVLIRRGSRVFVGF